MPQHRRFLVLAAQRPPAPQHLPVLVLGVRQLWPVLQQRPAEAVLRF
jgi:hypothetical protein